MSNVTVTVEQIETTVTEESIDIVITPRTETVTVTEGTSDHGLLTGLTDDDHPQYLTQERADARYLRVVGGSGDLTYRHVQMIPSATWVIDHPMEKYPSVSIVDTSQRIVYGDIQYNNTSRVTVTFSAAFAGEAHLN